MNYEFGGPEWRAFMHGLIVERAARLRQADPDISWSVCESFTDPPPSLSPDGAPLTWNCVVKKGEVIFGAQAIDDVDVRIIADYDAILPLGRYDTQGDPARVAELGRMAQDLIARGLLKVVGDRSTRNPAIGDFHDVIARVTA